MYTCYCHRCNFSAFSTIVRIIVCVCVPAQCTSTATGTHRHDPEACSRTDRKLINKWNLLSTCVLALLTGVIHASDVH